MLAKIISVALNIYPTKACRTVQFTQIRPSFPQYWKFSEKIIQPNFKVNVGPPGLHD